MAEGMERERERVSKGGKRRRPRDQERTEFKTEKEKARKRETERISSVTRAFRKKLDTRAGQNLKYFLRGIITVDICLSPHSIKVQSYIP